MDPLAHMIPPARHLADGGIEEVESIYRRYEHQILIDLRTLDSEPEIIKQTRRLQGAFEFLEHLKSEARK